jgi:hypothetical protein
VRAARSSRRGLPPLGLGGSSGNSGSTNSQSSSLTNSLAILLPYPDSAVLKGSLSGAITAANAAANGGVVYIPTGDYYVTGPFTLDNEVSIIGAGSPQVTINHSGKNSLLLISAEVSKRQW